MHSYTHTHTHWDIHFLSLAYIHILSLILSVYMYFSLSLSLSLSLSSLSLSLSCSNCGSFLLLFTFTYSHFPYLSPPHVHTLPFSLWLTYKKTFFLHVFLFIFFQNVFFSLYTPHHMCILFHMPLPSSPILPLQHLFIPSVDPTPTHFILWTQSSADILIDLEACFWLLVPVNSSMQLLLQLWTTTTLALASPLSVWLIV